MCEGKVRAVRCRDMAMEKKPKLSNVASGGIIDSSQSSGLKRCCWHINWMEIIGPERRSSRNISTAVQIVRWTGIVTEKMLYPNYLYNHSPSCNGVSGIAAKNTLRRTHIPESQYVSRLIHGPKLPRLN